MPVKRKRKRHALRPSWARVGMKAEHFAKPCRIVGTKYGCALVQIDEDATQGRPPVGVPWGELDPYEFGDDEIEGTPYRLPKLAPRIGDLVMMACEDYNGDKRFGQVMGFVRWGAEERVLVDFDEVEEFGWVTILVEHLLFIERDPAA